MDEIDIERRLEELAANVRYFRKTQGYLINELVARTGLTYNTLANIEARHELPSLRRLLILANALGVTPNQLLGFDEKPVEIEEGVKKMMVLTLAEIKNIKSYATADAEPYSATYINKDGTGKCEFFRKYNVASRWYRRRRKAAGFECGMLCVFKDGKWTLIREDR